MTTTIVQLMLDLIDGDVDVGYGDEVVGDVGYDGRGDDDGDDGHVVSNGGVPSAATMVMLSFVRCVVRC